MTDPNLAMAIRIPPKAREALEQAASNWNMTEGRFVRLAIAGVLELLGSKDAGTELREYGEWWHKEGPPPELMMERELLYKRVIHD